MYGNFFSDRRNYIKPALQCQWAMGRKGDTG